MLLTSTRAFLQGGSVVFFDQSKKSTVCGSFQVFPDLHEEHQHCQGQGIRVFEQNKNSCSVENKVQSSRPRGGFHLTAKRKAPRKGLFLKPKESHNFSFSSNPDYQKEEKSTKHESDTDEGLLELDQFAVDRQKVLQLALDGASLFIAGHAGTGKSFLLLCLIKALKAKGLCVAVTASTGMAALGLGGNTFHSTFGVSVVSDEEKKTSACSAVLHIWDDLDFLALLDVIIIDEISLLHAGYLEALDLAARKAPGRAHHMPFGGIQIILAGDFLQLMHNSQSVRCGKGRFLCKGLEIKAITPKEEINDEVKDSVSIKDKEGVKMQALFNRGSAFFSLRSRLRWLRRYCYRPVYESPVFQHCLLHLQLFGPVRQKEDPSYFEDLEKLRHGIISYRLSRSAILNPEDPNAIRLFSTKRAVSAFNAFKILELSGEERCFRSEFQVTRCSRMEKYASRSNDGQGRVYTEGIIIHFRNKYMCSLKYRRRAEELVYQLCSQCKLTDVVRIIIPPVPSKYSHHLSLQVQFIGTTRNGNASALSALQSAIGDKFLAKSKEAAAARKLWGAVATEVQEGEYMERLLRSSIERRYTKMIQHDHVLQHKRLKIGCRVMLLRNLNKKYVNGSLGTIVSFQSLRNVQHLLPANLKVLLPPKVYMFLKKTRKNSTDVQLPARATQDIKNTKDSDDDEDRAMVPVVRMDSDGKEVAIPWISIPLQCKESDRFGTVRVIAMPLTPAYAYTVHKVQGLTFEHSVLFDGIDFFPCDHLIYVAASRVKRFSQFRMINVTPRMVSVHRGALRFTSGVPSVGAAVRRWSRWKKTHKTERSLPSLDVPKGQLPDLSLYRAAWKLRRCGGRMKQK